MRCIYIFLSLSFFFFKSPSFYGVNAAPTYPAQVNSGNGYTGEGGETKGGDVVAPNHHDLIDDLKIHILSNNAGKGGDSSSGNAAGLLANALGGHGHGDYDSANSYTGEGGHAPGGSVYEEPGILNILSNNAGGGGHAKSGSIGDHLADCPSHSLEYYKEYRDKEDC